MKKKIDYTQLDLLTLIECIGAAVIQDHSIESRRSHVTIKLSLRKENVKEILDYIDLKLARKQISDTSFSFLERLEKRKKEANQEKFNYFPGED